MRLERHVTTMNANDGSVSPWALLVRTGRSCFDNPGLSSKSFGAVDERLLGTVYHYTWIGVEPSR